MRCTAHSVLIGTSLTAGLAAVLAACGTVAPTRPVARGQPATGAARLTIRPSQGTPTTVFRLQFTSPVPAAVIDGVRRRFVLELAGPPVAGCVSSQPLPVPPVLRAKAVDLRLDPARLGGYWCLGTYTVRMTELQSPACAPGTMCPQFVRVVGTVGQVSFRVTRRGV